MLIYCGEEDGLGAELIAHQFDSHFKLSMMVQGKILHAGRYIIMVAPEFNKHAFLNEDYQKIRTGIYSPYNIKLEKCKTNIAYPIMSAMFTNIAKGKEITEPLQKLPPEYAN